MRRMISLTVACCVVLLALTSIATSDTPQMMHYQGQLTDSGGAPLDTLINMTFTIYDDSIGSGVRWTEMQSLVEVTNGLFNVLLGSVNPISDTVFSDAVRWLGIKIGSDAEISPRTRLVSVPYAYRVATVDGASGGNIFGKVGIGAIDPDAKLHVESSDLYSATFSSDYPSSSTHVIHSEFADSGSYDAVAVYGQSTPADYWGYGGYFRGGYTGVYGRVTSTGSGLNTYYGVYGYVSGGTAENYGVLGNAYGQGLKFGVFALAQGSGTNYGVYARATGGDPNWAGYFYGDVNITGTLYGGKSMSKIDHPLDPENRYLCHSFVESPDMMNVYNGNVLLDANGEASVELPDYFEAVNKDFRYQLTAIGAPGPNLYVANKILNNRFKIAGGDPGMEVSWQVIGIRKGPFAQANRIQVEVDKPPKERGKYLHPEAYGLGEEYGIHYEPHKRMEEQLQEKSELKIKRK